MRIVPFSKEGLTWAALTAAACLALFALRIWIARQRVRREARLHIRRLASEIIHVAGTIEADLSGMAGDSRFFSGLTARCNECRGRSEASLASTAGLRRFDIDRLNRELELLHDDHRRIVDLRSDVDAALAGLRRSSSGSHSRSCKFATGSKPQRSRWSSTGFHTTSFQS